jgi:hypothetical protein
MVAPTSLADTPEAGVEQTISTLNALFARGASVAEIADAMYDGDDVVITGEGEPVAYRSLKSFMPRLEVYLANIRQCRLSVVQPIRHSGTLAAAFIAEHCAAGALNAGATADADARLLWVFRKSAKGWRVSLEMFSFGKF